ncbi:Uncharacterised protein [Vibrio cholerae]|nr:Uncharacterised protein [Vibrio cholerae]CSI55823.1 Uncharacterised protein [Vibrio cholerae]CSI81597.1 Uncharacterised protein [Vibrio cholerae]
MLGYHSKSSLVDKTEYPRSADTPLNLWLRLLLVPPPVPIPACPRAGLHR